MIRVVCGCGRIFKAEERHAGKRTRCPVCGASLVIGQTPMPESSQGGTAEVPSWWFPSVPQGQGSSGTQGASGPRPIDPEAVPTKVIESGPVAAPKGPEGPRGGHPGPQAVPGGAGRRLWPIAAGAAGLVLLSLGALSWMLSPAPGRGDAAGNKAPREAGQEPGPKEGAQRLLTPAKEGAQPAPTPDRQPTGSPRRLTLLVPAYIFPTGDGKRQWQRLIAATAKVNLIVIVNPASGPGADRSLDYASIIKDAAEHGVVLVGYVSTRYAERPQAEVKQDIDAWVRFYPQIAGFFLDQQPAAGQHQAYFAEVADHARRKLPNARIITNPGVPCDEIFLARRISDLACVFANADGFDAFELPIALKTYSSSQCAALVYQVADAAAMRAAVKEAIIKGIGYLYVTDGKLPNPWAQLPPYWDEEVDAVMEVQ
jgi:hypothetical protein